MAAAKFQIQFYNVSVPPNTLDKGEPADGTTTYTCNPLTWIDGLHATVTMEFTSAVEGANYCKITTDSRTLYCYKRDFSLGTAGRMSVSLELDPLMTNKEKILESDIIATRCSDKALTQEDVGFNAFLPDPMIPIVQTTKHVEKNNASNTLAWNENFLLVTVG